MDQQLFIAFAVVGGFIAAFHFLRLRHDTQDHKTLQEAIRADSPIVADLFEQLRDRPRRRSETTGMVLMALAVAIAGAALIEGGENVRQGLAAAMFPAMLGLVIYWRSIPWRPRG